MSPFGFDAIVEKDFFDVTVAYKKQWNELRKRAALNRIASLTGRHPIALSTLLAKPLKLVYGTQVKDRLCSYDEGTFVELLNLMGFNASRIVLEDIGHGFSGLNVFKLTTDQDERRISWLLKVGQPVRKIASEILCHRNMFRDGLTRRFSVPAFWWAPVVWKNLGAIAYEFEVDAKSLLAVMKASGAKVAFQAVESMLAEFYRGLSSQAVVPSTVLARFKEKLEKSTVPLSSTVKALTLAQAHDKLETSLVIGKGCEHGDLHCGNIMIAEKGSVLIDFAHYKSKSDDGIPLLDLAKLIIDVWAFALPDGSTDAVLSAKILEHEDFRPLVPIFSIHNRDTFNVEETTFLTLALECTMSVYCTYPDVSPQKKEEAKTALLAR